MCLCVSIYVYIYSICIYILTHIYSSCFTEDSLGCKSTEESVNFQFKLLYPHVKGMWVDRVILAGGTERVRGVRREENSRWTLDQSHSDLAVRNYTLHVWNDSLFWVIQKDTHTKRPTYAYIKKRETEKETELGMI